MKTLKSLGLLTLGLALFAPFQNCGDVSFESGRRGRGGDDLVARNNGRGYGGKLNYYRYVPDFTCESKESPVSHLELNGASTTLTENTSLFCAAQRQTFDGNLVDRSIFQSDIVGYEEGIFEGTNPDPQKIPANLVEVWCRDSKDRGGIETLTYYNRQSNKALSRIYYSRAGNDWIMGDFSVARIVAQHQVVLRNEQGFVLKVYRDRPATELGLFVGELEAVIEGERIARSTSCRLGGALDPKVWPARQIVDLNTKIFKFSPDGNHFAFASSTGAGVDNLFAANSDGSGLARVGPKMLQIGLDGISGAFDFSRDSKWLVYNGDTTIPGAHEMLKASVDGTLVTPLDPLIRDEGDRSLGLDMSGSRVIYLDQKGQFLKSAFLEGEGIVTLYQGRAFVDANSVVASENHVIFSLNQGPLGRLIYSSPLTGSELKNLTPPIDQQDWIYSGPQISSRRFGGRYATFKYNKISNATIFKVFLIAVDGSHTIELPTSMDASIVSPDGRLVSIRGNPLPSAHTQLFNVESGQIFNTPRVSYKKYPSVNDGFVYDSIFFTPDSRHLIMPALRDPHTGSQSMAAVAIDTISGREVDLCPGLSSDTLRIEPWGGANNLLILSFNKSTNILEVYAASPALACRRLNSASSLGQNVTDITHVSISDDQKKILVQLGAVTGHKANLETSNLWSRDETHSKLIYVPLDGRPSLLVNTPVSSLAKVSNARFLKDSRTVIFRGDQIRPSEENIFLWQAPP